MSIKSQQIEFDVFPKEQKNEYAYLGNIKNDIATEPSSINVVFSHQSVIIICICAVMLLVVSFSLGVEKGKLLAKNISGTTEKTNIAVASNAPAPVAVQQVQATQNHLPVTNQKNITLLAETKPVEVKTEVLLSQVKMPEAPKEQTQPLTGSYAIQIASVENKNAAKNMIDNLSKKGFNPTMKSSGKYIIILAGNFAKKEEAQVKLRELKKTYTDCYIRKI